ncbi:MAG: TraB/GumN family protein [Rhodobacter sp.]|nr:TraB/GumN family protein [Rhodobacter sp.]
MPRILVALLAILAALPVSAACTGTDLLAAMPAGQRDALEAAASDQPYPNGILWRAERGDQIIHVIGTLHLHDPRHRATLDRIDTHIARSDTVFLEFGPGDEKRLQAKIAQEPDLAFITDGPTLPDQLADEDWNRLRQVMADRGVPGFLAAKMKPWMAMTTLGIAKCALHDLQGGLRGLDHMVMERALELGKTPKALEPVETLFDIFGSYSPEEQLDLLRLTLDQQLDNPDAQMTTLIEAYFRGEIRLIWEWSFAVAQDAMGLSDTDWQAQVARAEEALINRRNRAWMDRILPAAADGEVLVAAGALHLPGEQGLLNLLARQGFTLTRLAR